MARRKAALVLQEPELHVLVTFLCVFCSQKFSHKITKPAVGDACLRLQRHLGLGCGDSYTPPDCDRSKEDPCDELACKVLLSDLHATPSEVHSAHRCRFEDLFVEANMTTC